MADWMAEGKIKSVIDSRYKFEELRQAYLLNTDSDLMANMYIVLNCQRKLLEHAYGYYKMELKLAFSSL